MLRQTSVLVSCMLAFFMVIPPATARADSYGAIAYSPRTGSTGWSYSFDTRVGAERRAMQGCTSHARDCRIAIWFVNACGALSVGSSGWGSGWGSDRARAEYEANRSCSGQTRGCRVIRWQCSGAR
ncbi:DUF4189 domain-containing protein [Rhizobium sp. RU36D]|uniref:DUF4189 domain-containing protein n=1 Tax=Rhizobium sp. RU36D TaxID=1907415 RepID=UPI0009D89268|nr:DUF4189 domain-containing protein [Rhizobium sp. RU36D]SMC56545.1 protein of unknown function [Rhizobium sp. RU36D]